MHAESNFFYSAMIELTKWSGYHFKTILRGGVRTKSVSKTLKTHSNYLKENNLTHR